MFLLIFSGENWAVQCGNGDNHWTYVLYHGQLEEIPGKSLTHLDFRNITLFLIIV
jgi:hypothetical protein